MTDDETSLGCLRCHICDNATAQLNHIFLIVHFLLKLIFSKKLIQHVFLQTTLVKILPPY